MSFLSIVLSWCLCWIISSSTQINAVVSLSSSTTKEEEKAPWWVLFQPSPKRGSGKDKSSTLKYTIYNPISSKFEEKLLMSSSTNNTNADGPTGLEGAGGNFFPQSLSYTIQSDDNYHCHVCLQATTSDCFFASSITVATDTSLISEQIIFII